jgi:hypothetical protein
VPVISELAGRRLVPCTFGSNSMQQLGDALLTRSGYCRLLHASPHSTAHHVFTADSFATTTLATPLLLLLLLLLLPMLVPSLPPPS